MNPYVTICIPTMNRRHVLDRAIDSALAQTYQPFHVLIIDNASTDGTEEHVLEKYREEVSSSKLKFIKFNSRVPIHANWNRCLNYADGDLIKFLFSDDTMDVNFLNVTASKFDLVSDALAASDLRYRVEENDIAQRIRRYCTYTTSSFHRLLFSAFGRNSIAAPSCSLFNLKIIKSTGLTFVNNRVACDIIFMGRLITYGKYVYHRNVMASIYISKNTETGSLKLSIKWILDNIVAKSILMITAQSISQLTPWHVKVFKYTLSLYCWSIIASMRAFGSDKGKINEARLTVKGARLDSPLIERITVWIFSFKKVRDAILYS